jgi:ribA/ribD-fused uncharacterized protein
VRKLRDLVDDGSDVKAEEEAEATGAAVAATAVAKLPTKKAQAQLVAAEAEAEAEAAAAAAAAAEPKEQIQEQPTDLADEGQPSRNELAEQVEPREGQPVLYFDSEMNKEFGTYFPAPMTIDGVAWPTAEHFFQAQKFTGSPEYQEKIRTTKNPSTAKTLGKTTDIPTRPDWEKVRDTIMIRVQRIKFQNKALADKLLATGNALLRYKAPQDNYWGIGRSGNGQNKLGRALMKIRAELQAAAAPAAAAVPAAAVMPSEVPVVPANTAVPNAGIGVGQGPVVIEKVGAEPPAPLFPEPVTQPMGGPVLEVFETEEFVPDATAATQQQQQPLAMEGGWESGEDVKVIKL